jgi:hypothetical protein
MTRVERWNGTHKQVKDCTGNCRTVCENERVKRPAVRGVSRGRCGIIVETAGNRREQGDGDDDGDGEGQQGGVQLSAMRTALFSSSLGCERRAEWL